MTVKQVNFNTKFDKQTELYEDLQEVICKYDGALSTAQVLGLLEIVKYGIMQRGSEDDS